MNEVFPRNGDVVICITLDFPTAINTALSCLIPMSYTCEKTNYTDELVQQHFSETIHRNPDGRYVMINLPYTLLKLQSVLL